jgi:hypothetical protein
VGIEAADPASAAENSNGQVTDLIGKYFMHEILLRSASAPAGNAAKKGHGRCNSKRFGVSSRKNPA